MFSKLVVCNQYYDAHFQSCPHQLCIVLAGWKLPLLGSPWQELRWTVLMHLHFSWQELRWACLGAFFFFYFWQNCRKSVQSNFSSWLEIWRTLLNTPPFLTLIKRWNKTSQELRKLPVKSYMESQVQMSVPSRPVHVQFTMTTITVATLATMRKLEVIWRRWGL